MTLNRADQWVMVIILCVASCMGTAENIGNYGQVFVVEEEDIRDHIMRRLKTMEASGELARRQREVTARVAAHIIRPTPLNLPTTTTPIRFTVDPTQRVSHDVFGPNGLLIAKKGTLINPFEHVTFTKTLFFIDGDSPRQVAWAKTHYKEYAYVKFILTGGDVRKASRQFGRVYFDIGARLTKTLQITHVPSVVNQDGRVWAVREIGVNDA